MNPWVNCRISCAFAVLAASVATVVFATGASAQTSPAEFARAWELGVPTTVIGTVTVIRTDDFVRQQSGLVHMIRDEGTGESFHLRFESDRPTNLRSGLRVQVRGRRSGAGVYGQELLVAEADQGTAAADHEDAGGGLGPGGGQPLRVLAQVGGPVHLAAGQCQPAVPRRPARRGLAGLAGQAPRLSRSPASGRPRAAASSTDTIRVAGPMPLTLSRGVVSTGELSERSMDAAEYVPGAEGTVGSVDSSRA
jgi:hypothetical protein